MDLSDRQKTDHLAFLRRSTSLIRSLLAEQELPDIKDGQTPTSSREAFTRIYLLWSLEFLVSQAECILLIAEKRFSNDGISSLLRSILETSVNVDNLINDAAYAVYLYCLSTAARRVHLEQSIKDDGMQAQFERAAAESVGQTVEQLVQTNRDIELICVDQLRGSKYLNRQDNLIDTAKSRFQWADRELDYGVVFRHLSSATHQKFPIKNSDGEMEWPRIAPNPYPLSQIDSTIRITLSTSNRAFEHFGGDTQRLSKLFEELERYYDESLSSQL